jgi:Transketolase, thiamine diphosphate binding domain
MNKNIHGVVSQVVSGVRHCDVGCRDGGSASEHRTRFIIRTLWGEEDFKFVLPMSFMSRIGCVALDVPRSWHHKRPSVLFRVVTTKSFAHSRMPFQKVDTDELSINTIRTLAADVVNKANSGHPGTVVSTCIGQLSYAHVCHA